MQTDDQRRALAALDEFLRSESTTFLLEGGAGVGKTWLLAEFLRSLRERPCLVCAPSHKAIGVLRRKLTSAGVRWGETDSRGSQVVLTGTSQAALGLRPVVRENEDGRDRSFAPGPTGGTLRRLKPRVVVIDEVSMLSGPDVASIERMQAERGGKLILIGDAAQLPPVNAHPIDFASFPNRAELRQIVRQAEGSPLIAAGWAVRDRKPYRVPRDPGSSIHKVADVAAAFVEAALPHANRPEERREVFIAYTNARVNEAQEAACRKVYGHGRLTFVPGERVLAETTLRAEGSLLCANQDELMVVSFDGSDPIGQHVTLRGCGGRFQTVYVPEDALKNPTHPYNVELEKRRQRAAQLQAEFKVAKPGSGRDALNEKRRLAWHDFFYWRDEMVISFRHLFAITSHKAQGSTYRHVFADVRELARFSRQGLYVAITRPSEELTI